MVGAPDAASGRSGIVIRASLAILGLAFIAYAVSDHPFYGGGAGFGKIQLAIASVGALLLVSIALSRMMGERLLLLTVSMLVMLGIGEIAVSSILGSSLRPIYQFDDRLIFKLVPNSEGSLLLPPVNGGETITHRVNSAGFRGPEITEAGPKNRILVYGDSFIHAPYTKESATFVRQLEGALASGLKEPVEVINAGVSSYGPDQISLRLMDDITAYRPDLVIVAIFAGNDFGDLMRNKIFRVGDNQELVPNTWSIDEGVRRNFDLGQSESLLLKALKRAWGVIRVAVVGKAESAPPIPGLDQMLEVARAEYRGFVLDGDNVVTNTHIDYYSADVSLEPNSASSAYKIRLMQLVMERITEEAGRANVPLAFLFIPHPADLMAEWEWGSVDRSRYPDYDGRNQTRVLETAATSLRTPYVSLFDVFREGGAARLYLKGGDDHWNSVGQRVAAEQMAEFIGRTGMLGGPRGGGSDSSTAAAAVQ
jgi:hypothetical protein